MFIIAAALALTPFQQVAYVSGRCVRFLSAERQTETEQTLIDTQSDLYLIYLEGIKDETRETTSFEVCKAALDDATKRINSPPQKSQPQFGRDTGKR